MKEKFQFMTVKEFSECLKVKNVQVYDWIKEGKVKALRVSSGPKSPWRIPETELNRMHARAYEVETEE